MAQNRSSVAWYRFTRPVAEADGPIWTREGISSTLTHFRGLFDLYPLISFDVRPPGRHRIQWRRNDAYQADGRCRPGRCGHGGATAGIRTGPWWTRRRTDH